MLPLTPLTDHPSPVAVAAWSGENRQRGPFKASGSFGSVGGEVDDSRPFKADRGKPSEISPGHFQFTDLAVGNGSQFYCVRVP
jgi:hypothetical protein